MSESHIRIDEGIKRGPRKPPQAPRQAQAPQPYRPAPLEHLTVQAVLDRLLADEPSTSIAKSLGVHRSALNQWLLRNCQEDWKSAQVARAISTLELAKEELRLAPDALSLARAREQVKAAQWELERLHSRLYGLKGDAGPVAAPVLNITLSVEQPQQITAAQPLIIDVQSVSESK